MRPTDRDIIRVIRMLSDYADGHELRGQFAAELNQLKVEAHQMIIELEKGEAKP